jgi:hypothetical protein
MEDEADKPQLKFLHNESSLSQASLDFWRRQSTAEIIFSLRVGVKEVVEG